MRNGFAFDAPALTVHYASDALVDYALKVVIECYPLNDGTIAHLLDAGAHLERHTSIYHFAYDDAMDAQQAKAARFRWSHDTIQPHGHTLPIQCPTCFSIRTFPHARPSSKRQQVTEAGQAADQGAEEAVNGGVGSVASGKGKRRKAKRQRTDDGPGDSARAGQTAAHGAGVAADGGAGRAVSGKGKKAQRQPTDDGAADSTDPEQSRLMLPCTGTKEDGEKCGHVEVFHRQTGAKRIVGRPHGAWLRIPE